MIILINAILVEYKFQENEFFDDKGEYLFGQQIYHVYPINMRMGEFLMFPQPFQIHQ